MLMTAQNGRGCHADQPVYQFLRPSHARTGLRIDKTGMRDIIHPHSQGLQERRMRQVNDYLFIITSHACRKGRRVDENSFFYRVLISTPRLPLSSREVAAVRKEKERLTAAISFRTPASTGWTGGSYQRFIRRPSQTRRQVEQERKGCDMDGLYLLLPHAFEAFKEEE